MITSEAGPRSDAMSAKYYHQTVSFDASMQAKWQKCLAVMLLEVEVPVEGHEDNI
jgi:hypothetical protein